MAPSSREFDSQSPELSLVRLPIRDDHVAQIMTAVLVLALAYLTYAGTVNIWVSLLVVFACLIAAWKMFLPVKIELGPRGIIQTTIFGSRKTPWREIARYQSHPHGVILYLTADDSPLAGFASIDLACRKMKTDLESTVRFYMESRRLRTGSSIVRMAEDASNSKSEAS
ncbi:hypothetical protein GC197_02920 [bacterium]|nr:hypothetical protein [bacterium]